MKDDSAFDVFYAKFLPFYVTSIQQFISRDFICAMFRRIESSIFIIYFFETSLKLFNVDFCPNLIKDHVSYKNDQILFANYDVTSKKFQSILMKLYDISNISIIYDFLFTNPSQFNKMHIEKLELIDEKLIKFLCIT